MLEFHFAIVASHLESENYVTKLADARAKITVCHQRAFCPVAWAWYGMENGMERKFRYGIWKMPEWNGMEDFKNGMEDNLPYFHTNSILDFVHCIYRKIHTDVG